MLGEMTSQTIHYKAQHSSVLSNIVVKGQSQSFSDRNCLSASTM